MSGSHAKVRVKTGHGAGRKRRLLKNGRPVYPMVTAREWLVEESAEEGMSVCISASGP